MALEVSLGRCAGGLAALPSSSVLRVALLRAVVPLRASLVARSRSRASTVLDRKLEMRPRRRFQGPSAARSSSSEVVGEGNLERGMDSHYGAAGSAGCCDMSILLLVCWDSGTNVQQLHKAAAPQKTSTP